ncbi:MAG: flagellar assembly protein FliW [Firmicutes bacterium]|nr:flagellar assembly protein FliW [Bacillota bacterium]
MATTTQLTLKMTPPLLGFEDQDTYTLIPIADNPYFFWLEAKDGPKFLLTKPEYFFPGYLQQVKSNLLTNIGEANRNLGKSDVYLIITLSTKPQEMTANLLAPLFIDQEQKLASQIVLHESNYTTRHYLFPPEKRRDCG